MKPKFNILHPQNWGLTIGWDGHLLINGQDTVKIAYKYGTPIHVLNEPRLLDSAQNFRKSCSHYYPGKTSIHYPFKCNSVPHVVEIIRNAGLHAEVMTKYELELALFSGYAGNEIIVNGPCKPNSFLQSCFDSAVRFIVVDSLQELEDINNIAASRGKTMGIVLRINPDYVPSGMNCGSATGSRKGSAFGLDFKGGEVKAALDRLSGYAKLNFEGFHFHIGTGIHSPKDYSNTLRILPVLISEANSADLKIRILDIGGGFASPTTREFTNSEMLFYQGFRKLPDFNPEKIGPLYDDFTKEISNAVQRYFSLNELPELIFEPGRCITSQNQFLLLTVHRIKERNGIGKWLITDGGLGTVTLPTYYEYHEVFLCNDVLRQRDEKVDIIGPACFAGDIVYRNKPMPKVREGDVIAIMDTGAYFNQLESSFGFPRPAIIAVRQHGHNIVRARDSFDTMIQRDITANSHKGTNHEILSY
jgi:diaminopimelate decarboxylase